MSAPVLVHTVLTAAPAVVAAAPGGVHFARAPQGVPLPHVVLVGGPDVDELMVDHSPAGLPKTAVSIIATASTWSAADALARTALATLFSASPSTISGRRVHFLPDDAGGDDFVPDAATFRRIVGVRVVWR